MSDPVVLALIDMIKSWGNVLFANLAVIVPAIGTAIIGWMTWRNNQRSNERAEILKDHIALIEAQAKRTKEEAALMAKGAERKGFEGGIRTERNRASDLGALQASFRPNDTNTFMADK
jgi:HAMP domain-containing protein